MFDNAAGSSGLQMVCIFRPLRFLGSFSFLARYMKILVWYVDNGGLGGIDRGTRSLNS